MKEVTSQSPSLKLNIDSFFEKYLAFLPKKARGCLQERVYQATGINDLFRILSELPYRSYGLQYIQGIVEHLQLDIQSQGEQNIPSQGPLIITSNHPLGAIDGIALLSAVSKIRSDVKIVAEQHLTRLPNTRSLLIPHDVFHQTNGNKALQNIIKHLREAHAIIIFPAGSISHGTFSGVQDSTWQRGVLTAAKRTNTPIIPAAINTYNSDLFYFLRRLHLAIFTLIKENLAHRGNTIPVLFGDKIDPETVKRLSIDQLRAKTYRLLE